MTDVGRPYNIGGGASALATVASFDHFGYTPAVTGLVFVPGRQLFNIDVSPCSAAQFVQIFDVSVGTAPASGTVPIMSWPIASVAAGASTPGFTKQYFRPRQFTKGILVALSTRTPDFKAGVSNSLIDVNHG